MIKYSAKWSFMFYRYLIGCIEVIVRVVNVKGNNN